MLKLRFKNNKQIEVWLVEPEVTIGRHPDNALVVEDHQVAEKHALVQVSGEQLTLQNISGGLPLKVNHADVVDRQSLKTNDIITLGTTELEVVDPKQALVQPPSAATDEITEWALKANHSALANRIYKLKSKTLVGRAKECDITLAAAHLSRRHAQLLVKDGMLYVKDLDSANGTFVNGERVSSARVNRGDELCFDTLSFGVIGPVRDLDKTTVRAAAPQGSQSRPVGNAAAKVITPKPVRVTRKPVSPAVDTGPKPKQHRRPPADTPPSPVTDVPLSDIAAPSSALPVMFVCVGLLLAAAGAYWAYSSGIF